MASELFTTRFLEVGAKVAGRQRRMDTTADTLRCLLTRGCTFRSVGYSVLIHVPDDLHLVAVATWAQRNKPQLLQILTAADRLEVADPGLNLERLYFARWLVHRGHISEDRR